MPDATYHLKLHVGDLAAQVAQLKAQIDGLAAENQRLVGENTLLHQQIAQLQPDPPSNVRPFTERTEPGT